MYSFPIRNTRSWSAFNERRSCLIPSSILSKKELLSKKHTLREKVVFFNNGSSPLRLLANILWISKRMGNLSLCGFGTFEVSCTLVLDWWVPFGNIVWCTYVVRTWCFEDGTTSWTTFHILFRETSSRKMSQLEVIMKKGNVSRIFSLSGHIN